MVLRPTGREDRYSTVKTFSNFIAGEWVAPPTGEYFENRNPARWSASRTRRQNRGQDLRYNLELSLEDAFRGQQAEIRVPAAVACGECAGTGAQHGSRPE